MKKIVAIILLIAFSFRPSYYVSQMIYYSLNIDYIIDKYCINKDKPKLMCNGKCHLAEKIQAISATTPEPDEAPLNNINTINAFIPVFSILKQSTVNLSINKLGSKKNFKHYKNNYSYLFSKREFKPPIVII